MRDATAKKARPGTMDTADVVGRRLEIHGLRVRDVETSVLMEQADLHFARLGRLRRAVEGGPG